MSNRIYPDKIPVTKNEPTKDSFSMVVDDTYGSFIISKKYFNIGDLVATAYGGMILEERELHTVQKEDGAHLYDKWFAGILAHSCAPNTYFDQENNSFYAIKAIEPGDSITHDYEVIESNLSRSFECHCKSINCRKFITGSNNGSI